MCKSIFLMLLAIVSSSAAAEWVKVGDMPDTPNQSVSVQTREQGGGEVTSTEPPKTPDHPAQGLTPSGIPALDENLKELKRLYGGRSACSNSSKF